MNVVSIRGVGKVKNVRPYADIVRQASHVIWTEGKVDRVEESHGEDLTADYAFIDWGSTIDGV